MASSRHFILILAIHLLVRVRGQFEESKCRGISRGKEFVVGFTTNHGTKRSELHISVVAFSNNDTTVTISSRYQNYQVTFELPPRGYRRTTIPLDFRLEDASVRSNKVLTVMASSDVTVYGANYEAYTTDAFLSLPNDQLGLHHVVVSHGNVGPNAALLAVIGIVDATNVYITLTGGTSFEGRDYEPGDVLTFEIDRHEIVQIVADRDLSGTIIKSDNAVAAIGGHQCAKTPGSACDILVEQLIPVNSWGTSHIYTATGGQGSLSIYKIVAFFEDTRVSIPGVGNRTLNAGAVWEGSLSGSGVISSTLPSSVTQILRRINGGVVDPSIIQVPSEEQFAFKFGFATPPTSGEDSSGFFNFINIVVRADECHLVVLNRQGIRCNETAVDIPGTEYVAVALSLPKGESAYFLEGTPGSTPLMSAIVYGYEDHESYGYAAGLSLPNDGRLLSVNPFIVSENGGDNILTTLPCLEQKGLTTGDVVCRFRDGSIAFDVPGVLVIVYQVSCNTYIFSHVGLTSLDVSLDGGETFPYSDTIYVASQYDIPSRVAVSGLTPEFAFVNLAAADSNVTILWDSRDFPNNTHVSLGVFVEDPTKVAGWSDEIFLESKVSNDGQYDITQTLKENPDVLFGSRKSSIVGSVFFVTPHRSDRSQRGIKDYIVKRSFRSELHDLRETNQDKCSEWLDELENVSGRLGDIPPCPPTLVGARRDERYSESNAGIGIYHRGAVACFRRDAANGAGTQCCYDGDGRLLLVPPGGGTADAYAPGFFGSSKHLRFDVRPWIACCNISNNPKDCPTYYEFRPAVNSEGYNRSTLARGTGDPHFITLDQREYTFNAAGEFTLLQSELHNITFQGRMEQIPGLNASVFSAFVLQGERVPKLQIQRSSLNRTLVLLDDVELTLTHKGITLPRFTIRGGTELQINRDQTKLVVRLPVGLVITFNLLSDMMSYNVNIDDKFRGQTRGLLGNFNGDPTDDLTSPDGDVLPINSSLREIHFNFGLKWMVNKSESIFMYMQSEDFESYHRPEFMPSFVAPDPTEIDQEVVELCGSSAQCLFDAVNTGSISFANETLSDVREYYEQRETLQRIVNCNFPRELNNSKKENIVYYVNSSYEFQCLEGFTLVGNPRGHCGVGGKWNPGLPTCVRQVTCNLPSEFVNGDISGDGIYNSNRSYTVQCNQGYFLLGDEVVHCDVTGTWFGDFPSCFSVWLVVGFAVAMVVAVLLLVIICAKKCGSKRNIV